MALGGYMQLRWFEFARDATQWTNATGRELPINNINTFNINRFLLSFHGHVVDERLVYNFALFGTTNVGIRSGVVPIGLLGWKFSDAATVGGGMRSVPGTRVYVGNLDERLTERDLEDEVRRARVFCALVCRIAFFPLASRSLGLPPSPPPVWPPRRPAQRVGGPPPARLCVH